MNIKVLEKLQNEEGFTLIEVLFASMIFIIGVVAILELSTINLRVTRGNSSRLEAQRLAKEKLEQLSRCMGGTPSGTEKPDIDGDGNPDQYTVDWTVTPSGEGIALVKGAVDFSYVEIKVSWLKRANMEHSGTADLDDTYTLYGILTPDLSIYTN